MVQKTTVLALDLNVVAQVFPVKHRRSSSETAGGFGTVALLSDDIAAGDLPLDVALALLLAVGGHLALSEDEDLASALGRLGVLGGHDVSDEEADHESEEDANVPVNELAGFLASVGWDGRLTSTCARWSSRRIAR